MILESRLIIFIGQLLHAPPWCQISVPLSLALFGPTSAIDPCIAGVPIWLQWLCGWLFGTFNFFDYLHGGCAIFYNWVQWYVVVYVVGFHYCRPAVTCVTKFANGTGCFGGPGFGAATFGAYMFLGSSLAAFHYPDVSINTGTDDPNFRWGWLPVE